MTENTRCALRKEGRFLFVAAIAWLVGMVAVGVLL